MGTINKDSYKMKTKTRTWSRKKIRDKFSGLLKADGTPMSRQQIHMLRKKARGICLTCGEPAIGVYCLKHTIAARERMRQKLKYRRRLRNSSRYLLEKEVRSKRRHSGMSGAPASRSRMGRRAGALARR